MGGTLSSSFTGTFFDCLQRKVTVVDESAVTSECNIVGAASMTDRLVLIGDEQQLPPISRNFQMRRSLQERLSRLSGMDPILLSDCFRMVEEIAAWPNMFYYESKLKAMRGASKRKDLPAGFPWPDSSPIAFIHVNGMENQVDKSYKNIMI